MKPFIIFAGAQRETKSLDKQFKIKYAVGSLPNVRMNEKLRLDWVKIVLRQVPFASLLLVWDTLDSHLTEQVLSFLKTSSINDMLIPEAARVLTIKHFIYRWFQPN